MEEYGTIISNKYRKDNDIYSKIVETEEEVKKIKESKSNYLSYIHCNGCFRKCFLSTPSCGRGKNLSEQI